MDSGDKDKFLVEKRNEDPLNYNAPNLSLDWQHFKNTSMGSVPIGNPVGPSSISSAPMLDAYCPMTWEHPITSQNLAFCNNNIQTSTSIDRPHDIGWNPISSLLKGSIFLPSTLGLLPPSLTQFPADSGFIERAARFSCFSTGNFSDMVNPFSNAESMTPHPRIAAVSQQPHGVFIGGHSQMNEMHNVEGSKYGTEGSPLKNDRRIETLVRSHGAEKQDISVSENLSDEAEVSGGDQEELSGSAKRFGSTNKRKRPSQDTRPDQVVKPMPLNSDEATKGGTDIQQKGGQNISSPHSKNTGKHSKQGSQASEPAKDEYIHIRARRGQATNSHSLAERVRREKISERMKFLQDLVPCCSKVTGKAVMLDEIINYVQSLQRQVEFLSMKLATVNPQLDFNMESLLTKDSHAGPSSTLGFPSDLYQNYPQLHPSQQGLIQAGLPNSGDTFRRTMNTHLVSMSGGLKEPIPQLPNAWEDQLHNVVQMGFGPNTPADSQDLNGRSC